MSNPIPLVKMCNIHKKFGAVQALRGVDLTLYKNEVLGLVGDNAAGKSTLMKILTGAYAPDQGEIFVDGQAVRFWGPEESRRLGIEMVYQDFALANNLDISSNIFLGREEVLFKVGPLKIMNKPLMESRAKRLMQRLKIDIASVRARVENLSGGQRQAVAIGRATAFNAQIIIMDEPTAAMSIAAIEEVMALIKQLKAQGASIIIISHRLEDIYQVADRVIALRHGYKVADMPINHHTVHHFRDEMVAYITGARNDFAGSVPG
ncbi:MAG: sugar ABC transporter ATP-binding protein [Anaerolineae bacterium]|nr:sugar ABC transporter ATP-binding protein [Anaerolineae bacterium]